jgi:Ribbon-helix-helix protein, copG family
MAEKLVMLSCWVDQSTIARLTEAARTTGRTRSQLVRYYLDRVALSGTPDLVMAAAEDDEMREVKHAAG